MEGEEREGEDKMDPGREKAGSEREVKGWRKMREIPGKRRRRWKGDGYKEVIRIRKGEMCQERGYTRRKSREERKEARERDT